MSDTLVPVISGLSLSSVLFDPSQPGGAFLNGIVSFSDDLSGLSDIELSYRSTTTGQIIYLSFNLNGAIDGNALNGSIRSSNKLEPNTASGEYILNSLSIYDQAGNSSFFSNTGGTTEAEFQSQLDSFGVDASARSFTINNTKQEQNSTEDTSTPIINNLSLSSVLLDPSQPGGAFLTVNADFSDTGSGLEYISLSFQSVETGQSISFYLNESDTIEGSLLSGTVSASQEIDPFAASGEWKLTSIESRDKANNYFSFSEFNYGWEQFLTDSNIQSSFFIDNPQAESTAPIINNLSLSSVLLDPSQPGGASLTVNVDFSDTGSGLKYISLSFQSVETGQSISFYLNESDTIEGSLLSGTVSASQEIDPFAASGEWKLTSIESRDKANNYFSFSEFNYGWEQFLTDSNIQSSFFIDNPQAESTAPIINNLSLSSVLLDPSQPGGASLTVNVDFSDTGSGLKYISLSFQSVETGQSISFYLNESDTIEGSLLSGTVSASQEIDPFAASGEWKLTSIESGDKANNYFSFSEFNYGWEQFLTDSNIQSSFFIGRTLDSEPTYFLTTSTQTVPEGSALAATVYTDNVEEGTTLFWKLNGNNVDANDFIPSELNGSGEIDSNGQLSFDINIADDQLEEGNETLNIQLYTDSAFTNPVGTNLNINISESDEEDLNIDRISFSSTTINAGDPGSSISAVVDFSDNLSGLDDLSITLQNTESNDYEDDIYLYASDRDIISGNRLDGSVLLSRSVDEFTKAGTYQISRISGRDQAGNNFYLGSSEPYWDNYLSSINLLNPTVKIINDNSDDEDLNIVRISFSSTTINAGDPGSSISAVVDFSDNLSGLDDLSITLQNTESNDYEDDIYLYASDRDIISGNRLDGSVLLSRSVDEFTKAGTYQISRISGRDQAGNNFYLDRSEPYWDNYLSSINLLNPTVKIINDNSDDEDLNIERISFSSTTINAANPGSVISAVVDFSDNLSGLDDLSITLQNTESNDYEDDIYLYASDRDIISGNRLDGRVLLSRSVDEFTKAGTYQISRISGRDQAGNDFYLGSSEPYWDNYLSSIDILQQNIEILSEPVDDNGGLPDTINPTITGLSLNTTSIDPSVDGDAFIAATVDFQDNLSGVRYIDLEYYKQVDLLTLEDPYDIDDNDIDFYFNLDDDYSGDIITGNSRNGTAISSQEIDQYQENGIYELAEISIGDEAGNRQRFEKYLYTSNGPSEAIELNSNWDTILSDLGIEDSTFTVNNPNEDTINPTITGLSLNTTSIDPSVDGGAFIAATIDFQDNLSGVRYIDLEYYKQVDLLTLEDPYDIDDNDIDFYFNLDDDYSGDIITGNSRNGTAISSQEIDQYQENGIYELAEISIGDEAGNRQRFEKYLYTSNGPSEAIELNSNWDTILSDLGIEDSTFTVNNPNEDTINPTITGLSLNTTSIDPSVDGGAFIAATVDFQDNLSGVRYIDLEYYKQVDLLTLEDPYDIDDNDIDFYFNLDDDYSGDIITGNSRNGTAISSQEIDQYQENGIYELAEISIGDEAGNRQRFEKYLYTSNGPSEAIELNSNWDTILSDLGIEDSTFVINRPVEFLTEGTTIGDVTLGSTEFGYAIQDGDNGPVQVQYAGGFASQSNPGTGWKATAAVQANDGYSLYWRNQINDQYAQWNLDAFGTLETSSLLSLQQVLSLENQFDFDLSGDGDIGLKFTPGINSIGSINLGSTVFGYAIQDGDNGPVQVQYAGGFASQSNPGTGWKATAAVQANDGYSLYWRNQINDQYAQWNLDAFGTLETSSLLSLQQVLSLENQFDFDLSGDGDIGLEFTPGINSIGSINLGSTVFGYAIQDGDNGPVQVQYAGGFASQSNPGAGWKATAAVQANDGYSLYWRNQINDQYAQWNLDAFGTLETGSSLSLQQVLSLENQFDVDLSGDGDIGLEFTPGINSIGSVNLGSTVFGYAIQDGGNGPVQVQYAGGFASQSNPGAGWKATAAVQANDGYSLYWRNQINDQYAQWNLDAFGTLETSSVRTEVEIINLENEYIADLNGDSLVGLDFEPTDIVNNGVRFGQTDVGYALLDETLGKVKQISLKNQSINNQNPGGGWEIIGTSREESGNYNIYWRNDLISDVSAWSEWELNNSGQFITGRSLNIQELILEESRINVDLSGDGDIGLEFTPGINSIGSVNLGSTVFGYAIQDGDNGPVQVQYAGGFASQSNPGTGWKATAAVQANDGYSLYWRNQINDQYAQWNLDAFGTLETSSLLSLQQVLSLENQFDFDLSGDGDIGLEFTPGINSIGSINLGSTVFGYAIQDGDNGPVQVQYAGGFASQSNPGTGWKATAAVQANDGYSLYWRNQINDQYAQWNLDAFGTLETSSLLSLQQVLSLENQFDFDLSGDGDIGLEFTPGINSIGSINLGSTVFGYAIQDGDNGPVQVQYAGGFASQSNPGTGWKATAAVQANDGYSLYWRNQINDQYAQWNLDAFGTLETGSSLSLQQVLSLENQFDVDLSGDGDIGLEFTPGINSIGSVNLGSTVFGYAIQDGGNGPVQVQYAGGFASQSNPGAGWEAIGALESAENYLLYWANADSGSIAKWKLDLSGQLIDSFALTPDELIEEESVFNADINRDGLTGYSWTYNNHQYQLVKEALSYEEAVSAANERGGYLAEIEDTNENNAIFDNLTNYITNDDLLSTTATDGGGAAYVWLGGSDREIENNWQWEQSGDSIGLDRDEWGSGPSGNEPDNFENQDALALSLESWPLDQPGALGLAGQWNDLSLNNNLYYIIEYNS